MRTTSHFTPHFTRTILIAFCLLATLAALSFFSGRAFFSGTPNQPKVKHGPATIALREGYDLPAAGQTADEVVRPAALAAADFDVDGYPDLVSGYAKQDGGGALSIQRGNPEAFAPTQPENVAAIAAGRFPVSFLAAATTVALPGAPDWVVTGDFNRDSDPDVLAATRGGSELYLAAGDGDGGFAAARGLPLPGRVTALAAGQIDLTDGKDDLLVGLALDKGAALLVYEDGLAEAPVRYALPAAAQAVALGELDDTVWADAAILADGKVYILHGRNQRDGRESAKQAAARLEALALPFAAQAMTLGQFIWERAGRTELALLREDGTVAFVARGTLDTRPFTVAEARARRHQQRLAAEDNKSLIKPLTDWQPNATQRWAVAESLNVMEAAATRQALTTNAPLLFSAQLSGQQADDLIVMDAAAQELKVFAVETPAQQRGEFVSFAGPRARMAVPVASAPVAALAMRLNLFARAGLVLLREGSAAALMIPAAPTATFTVSKTADTNDGMCDADCSLREAVRAANAAAGADLITFTNLVGSPDLYTLTLAGANENAAATGDLDITDAITITGNGSAETIVQAGASAGTGIDKVFSINPSFTLAFATSLSGMTIRFGKNPSGFGGDGFGGGLDWDGSGTGTLSITNCIVTQNTTADGDGGGITLTNGSGPVTTVTITGTTVSNNQPARVGGASPFGGGIFVGTFTSVNMTNTTLTANNVNGSGGAGEGGGYFSFQQSTETLQLHGCTITNNQAPSHGGGVRSTQRTTIDQNSVFTGNSSGGQGGGLFHNQNNTTATSITKTTFTNNSAATSGGAIRLGSGTTNNNATISFCRFAGNTAPVGSGLAVFNGNATAENNWWGCNSGPGNALCNRAAIEAGGTGTLDFDPWLVLTHSYSPSPIVTGQSSTLTASFLRNSAGTTLTTTDIALLLGLPITFNNAVRGTLSGAQSTIQPAGTATTTFTANAAGAGSATTVVDNSTDAVAAITINPAATTLGSITDGPDPSVTGQPYAVGFTLGVTPPGSATPTALTGTVTVSDGTGGMCTATLPATNCMLTSTTAGVKTLTLTYSGDSNFNTSNTTAGHMVSKADTTTMITADTPDPSMPGQAVTVNFTVTANLPGGGTPPGNVTVSDSASAATCTFTLAAGMGGCMLTPATAGARTLTAMYLGDDNYNGSTSAGEPHDVATPPTLTKTFTQNQIPVGQTSTLQFTINNPNGFTVNALAFTDPLPGGVTVLSGSTATCGGTLTTTAPDQIAFSGGLLAANSMCNFSVTVTGATAGVKPNSTSTITSANAGTGAAATATLTVVGPPTFSKAFTPASIPLGQTSTLNFTITNNHPTVALTGIGFIDVLPAGTSVADATTLNVCGVGSSLSVVAATRTVTLTGGNLAAANPNPTTCTIPVTMTGTAAGDQVNTTGNITANESGAGGTATATLNVVAPPVIAKAFMPSSIPVNAVTQLVISIANPAANTVALTGVGFTDNFPAGLVVANPPGIANGCGGVLNDNGGGVLATGDTGLMLTGGMVGATPPRSCTITVNVTPLMQGPFVNLINNATSANGGGASTPAMTTLVTNQPPTITPLAVTRKAGSSAATFNIATVADFEDPAGALTLKVNGALSATVGGITVSNLINTAGSVTASVATACNATTTMFTLTVTDTAGSSTPGPLTVTVDPNMPPMLAYNSPQGVAFGGALTVNPAAVPSDNGVFSFGAPTVAPAGFTGAISVNIGGVVSITNAALPGSYTVTVPAIDTCGATTNAQFTLNIACPTVTITTPSLAAGQAGVPYNQPALTVTPGGGNYTFSATGLPAGLSINAATGAITGTTLLTGGFTVTINVVGFGAAACPGNRSYTLNLTCPTITVANPPSGTAGTAYNATLAASPAGGGYTFSGTAPAGLTLAANGVLSGTPTTAGTFNFNVTVTGFGGACSVTLPVTLTINCPTITVNPATLPAASAGAAYNQTVSATPANTTYSFAVTGGSLPPGLTLNAATGVISGTPTTAGNYGFTITATGFNGTCSGARNYTLQVTACTTTVTVNPLTLPGGTVGTSYPATTITATPAGTYTFGVSGLLPPGLSLDPNTGGLSGTPTASGLFSFTITATSAGGCRGSRSYSRVSIACPPVTFTPTGPALPPATVGVNYQQTITVAPGTGYTFSIIQGNLPPGMTLNPTTGALSGPPTAPGGYSFTIRAALGNCQPAAAYTLTVVAAAAMAVVGDFDGDRKTDLGVWRGMQSDWLIVNSANNQLSVTAWGTQAQPYNDVLAPGDYDGDGKIDWAVYRRSDGKFYVKGSANGAVLTQALGTAGDVPVPGNYDGDRKTDFALWSPASGNWTIKRSTDGATQTSVWGSGAAAYLDAPVPGDYDGDGRTDLAFFRRSNGHWYIKRSSDGGLIDKAWGLGTDVPVPGDYDGDGKCDFAVWRGADTNWYMLRSSDGTTTVTAWGSAAAGDVPTPGDYDGDGKCDVAVWREPEGRWYIVHSGTGAVRMVQHGRSGDTPVTSRRQP